MKKIYTQPEWKVVSYTEDLITTSGDVPAFDPEGLFNDNTNVDNWEW